MIGQKLGSFRIEAKIGTGAMGAVYRAVQEPKGRIAAIKIIAGEQATKGNAASRFARESDILQQFRHPNIVRFLAVGKSQGIRYFAMEYVEGGTLDQLLAKREYLPWREVLPLGIQLCDALHYAHQHGVVHRDLKPSNLMITEKGQQLKLTDFGIAKDLDATALTATGRTLGTAAYMAPEQIRGTPEVSHKTDLYALGCVLYQMLTGSPPFVGKSAVVLMHSHLTEPAPRPSAKNPDMPLSLDNLVVGLMAKEPSDRPWDAAAAGQVLTELQEKLDRGENIPMVFTKVDAPSRMGAGVPTGTTLAQTVTRTRKGTSKHKTTGRRPGPPAWVGSAALAAAGLLIVAFLAYMFWPPGPDYLFAKAKALMDTPERSNWLAAKSEYIEDLKQRFPDHQKEVVQGWLDRIDLTAVERRAYVLEHPTIIAGTQPANEVETQYVQVFKEGVDADKAGLEAKMVDRWNQLADSLGDDPAHRGWVLLARNRAEKVKKAVDERRKAVATKLDTADVAERNNNVRGAVALRREVVEEYQKHPELADLVDRARKGIPEAEPPDDQDE